MKKRIYDFAIVGGGLVGLATARALLLQIPNLHICIMEKEDKLGQHQSGRNSGVIHSGIYYKPDTLKTRLTIEGREELISFCSQHKIKINRCGKVVLAKSADDLSELMALQENAQRNGLESQIIDQKELSEIEPFARAIAAIWLPGAAIVDYSLVLKKLAMELSSKKVKFLMGAQVRFAISHKGIVKLGNSKQEIEAKYLINCGGLYSDQIARMMSLNSGARIIPFRGQYFHLKGRAKDMVRGLIYPVPDPKFPFLGVHLTRTIHGEVLAGPNAVLSLKREGYQSGDINIQEALGTLLYSGFWRFAIQNMSIGAKEYLRSWSRQAFFNNVKTMLPDIKISDLVMGRSGVRAQAVSKEGKLLTDFHFERGENSLHVINAPSPAATACLAIGANIAKESLERNKAAL